jgi:hypothetical protein
MEVRLPRAVIRGLGAAANGVGMVVAPTLQRGRAGYDKSGKLFVLYKTPLQPPYCLICAARPVFAREFSGFSLGWGGVICAIDSAGIIGHRAGARSIRLRGRRHDNRCEWL